MNPIQIKRVYEPRESGDGQCFLVERLWPRGISKESMTGVTWLKEVAPSPELRQWFSHDPARWEEFQQRYRAELESQPQAWQPLVEAARRGTVTLFYSARDTTHNSALLLRDFLVTWLAAHR